jgi:uncharacterized membrane protein YGL010W
LDVNETFMCNRGRVRRRRARAEYAGRSGRSSISEIGPADGRFPSALSGQPAVGNRRSTPADKKLRCAPAPGCAVRAIDRPDPIHSARRTPMPAKKSADEWFADYGESHQDDTNELIHWICVPVIFWCVLGFIWSIPVAAPMAALHLNWLMFVALLVLGFYFRLSRPLAGGMLVFVVLCYASISWVARHASYPVWQICLVLFVLAWIGQFIGHKIEGKKPSFFKDLVFLLIGPAWLLSMVYRKIGLRY